MNGWKKEVSVDRFPQWDGVVPFCDNDRCHQYDGKRCKMTGFRPGSVCEPTVAAMGEMLETNERKS
jgi:hypothetical protein